MVNTRTRSKASSSSTNASNAFDPTDAYLNKVVGGVGGKKKSAPRKKAVKKEEVAEGRDPEPSLAPSPPDLPISEVVVEQAVAEVASIPLASVQKPLTVDERLLIAYEALRTLGSKCGGFNMITDIELVSSLMKIVCGSWVNNNLNERQVYIDVLNIYAYADPSFLADHVDEVAVVRARAVELWHWMLVSYAASLNRIVSNAGKGAHNSGTAIKIANKVLKKFWVLDKFETAEIPADAWQCFHDRIATDEFRWRCITSAIEDTEVWRRHHDLVTKYLNNFEFS